MPRATVPVEYPDMQGLVRFGHGRLEEACYLLMRVVDRDAAKAWLKAAPVTTAEAVDPVPDTALQIALTPAGLRAMGVPAAAVEGFSDEFRDGMAGDPNRSRRLGDVGSDTPARWYWGTPDVEVHLLLMLFAQKGRLDAWESEVKGPAWAAAFAELHRLDTNDIGDVEPFGYADGVSQPDIDWQQELVLDRREVPGFRNSMALGELLLGYVDEYGLYTDRPLLDVALDPAAGVLPPAEDNPHRFDFGRNGTYLVVRQLEQDVRGFWQFLDRTTGGDTAKRDALGSAMVGRHRNGDPLLPRHSQSIPGIGPKPRELEANAFLYDDDPDGTRCPFGAHIRRANPRTGDLPGGEQRFVSWALRTLGFKRPRSRDDMIASTRFHRLVRRGREYGPLLTPEDALLPTSTPEPERGLHFICLCANISRQFEFVQNAWIASAKFDGLGEEADPLLGNREPLLAGGPTDRFSIPRADGPPRRIESLPRFVTVRGGGYFFLPGLRALRYVAEAGR